MQIVHHAMSVSSCSLFFPIFSSVVCNSLKSFLNPERHFLLGLGSTSKQISFWRPQKNMKIRWFAFKTVETAVPICSWDSCKLLNSYPTRNWFENAPRSVTGCMLFHMKVFDCLHIQSTTLILSYRANEITVITEFHNVENEQAEFEELEHVVIFIPYCMFHS